MTVQLLQYWYYPSEWGGQWIVQGKQRLKRDLHVRRLRRKTSVTKLSGVGPGQLESQRGQVDSAGQRQQQAMTRPEGSPRAHHPDGEAPKRIAKAK